MSDLFFEVKGIIYFENICLPFFCIYCYCIFHQSNILHRYNRVVECEHIACWSFNVFNESRELICISDIDMDV